MNVVSNLVMPLIVLLVVLYGVIKKISVYDVFIDGAKQSFEMIINMFPCILGMIFGINILLESGLIDIIISTLKPLFNIINIPTEILPISIMRPISGSGALAILNDLLTTYGADSIIGRIGSVIQGSTETTLYVITLYFGIVGIKKIKYALWAGLFADLIGIISSIVIVNMLF